MVVGGLRPVFASGECEIDLAQRELRVLGSPVPVGARAFEIIEILAQSAGELVTKNELMSRVWPGAIVNDNTLQVHISAVRKALGSGRAMLRTESGRGYRLMGDWAIQHDPAERAVVDLPQSRSTVPLRLLPEAKEAPADNFPVLVTDLVGRSAALPLIRELLSAYRVVTLTGPGGIGKTTLALHAAHGLDTAFDGGRWLVELASLSNPDLVPSAVASALGLRQGEGVSAESVARAIGAARLLLILDNCEHVIDAAAELAETLVRQCPRVTILLTSREILRIDGEYVYRVPPLDVPASSVEQSIDLLAHSSVEFFVARTHTQDANFTPDAATLSVVAEICRHLDGIPLAIEFAVARARTLGLSPVAAMLHDRFSLLTSGRRTALPRHQTLRATLDWSYGLLTRDEQLFFRCLAIFAGGFTLEAASNITSQASTGGPGAVGPLADLVAKSLVVAEVSEGESRFRLLDTTRAYGLEKLRQNGEFDRLARRHGEYYQAVFDRAETEWETRNATEWLADYGWQINNLRAALDWAFSPAGNVSIGAKLAAAAVPLWMHLSLLEECGTWMAATLDAFPPERLGTRQELVVQLGFGYTTMITQRISEKTRATLERAAELGEALGDLDYQLRALVCLVVLSRMTADFSSALALSREADAIAQEISTPLALATTDCLLGSTLLWVGQYGQARSRAEAASRQDEPEVTRAHRVRHGYDHRMNSRSMLAQILWGQGFPEQSLHLLEEVVVEAEQMSHPFTLAYALTAAGCLVPLWAGDLQTAEHRINRLKEYAGSHALGSYVAAGVGFEGLLCAARGDNATGERLARAAVAELHKRGFHVYHMVVLSGLAEILANLGDVTDAMAAADEAVACADRGNNGWWMPEALRVKGEVIRLTNPGNNRQAEDFFRRAIDLAHSQGGLSWELRAATGLARLLRDQTRPADATAILQPVYDRFTEGFGTADLARAKTLLDELQ
jgi:predicted ATPase/DNA-binding winged helix-turn-helix (wHTH) protein